MRPRRAFTLIEIAMVLAIITIVSTMAIPRFSASLVRNRADQAAQRLTADLEWIRGLALRRGESLAIVFDVAGDAYRMPGVADHDHPDTRYEADLRLAPYEVDLVSADFGGNARVTFDGYGVPNSAGQIVLQAGAEIRTVSVAAGSGSVSVAATP